MEKAWAQRAGLGWIGRNGLLVQRGRGSFSVLGGLALTVDVEPDEPARDGCGECTACIDACPVGAIGDDRLVDARRCLSCLTIERRGELDVQSAGRLEGRQVFGCDLCQLACPHNERPTEGPPELDPRPLLAALTPREYLQLDEPGAGWVLRGTALERTGARVLKENVRAALGDPISRDARW
jgi:epoxyqueuosine reductase